MPHLFARGVSQAVNGEHVIRFTREDVVPQLVAAQATFTIEASAVFAISKLEEPVRHASLPTLAPVPENGYLVPLERLSARRDAC